MNLIFECVVAVELLLVGYLLGVLRSMTQVQRWKSISDKCMDLVGLSIRNTERAVRLNDSLMNHYDNLVVRSPLQAEDLK